MVAVFGATPAGNAAGRILTSIPPFAKTAGYAKTAGDARSVGGIRASRTPKPGLLVPLGPNGKFPASVGGPVNAANLLGKTITVVASRTYSSIGPYSDYVVCPAGYEAVGGGAYATGSVNNLDVRQSYPVGADRKPSPDAPRGAPATGWGEAFVLVSPVSTVVHYTVVCAKAGA